MIVHQVTQGSIEWQRLRIGLPTASEFHRIITSGGKDPSKAKLSEQSDGYICHLLAELFMGEAIESPKTEWMERGTELEEQAAEMYAFQNDVEVVKVGFVTNGARTYGASPDRMVGDVGLLETKCPKPEKHVEYMVTGGVDDKYRVQLQGQLYVCEREWVDIVSHHPDLPQVCIRVKRDEVFIGKLAQCLEAFTATLGELRIKYAEHIKPIEAEAKKDYEEFLTQEDADAILADLKQKGAFASVTQD